MRIVGTASAIAIMTFVSVGTAEAKGCIKGAIIGGIAGHYLAERGLVGAVAGCIGGRYIANRRARRDVDYGSRVEPRGTGYGQPQGAGRRNYSY